jgi:hypothetical protein
MSHLCRNSRVVSELCSGYSEYGYWQCESRYPRSWPLMGLPRYERYGSFWLAVSSLRIGGMFRVYKA